MCKGESHSGRSSMTTPPEPELPKISQIWRKAYFMVPKVNFPGTSLSISFTLVSSLFLMTIRLVSSINLEWLGFPEVPADEAAASVAGVIHSSLLCPGLVIAFMSYRYNPSEHLSKAPQWWQEFVDALLQFCTGYMVYDAVFILMNRMDPSVSWIPALVGDDFLFLGHHLATTTYMTQTRVYKAGHMSAMMCMLLGEASNPAMNTWFVTAKAVTLDCCNSPLMRSLHIYIEIIFAAVYLLFRVVIGPVVCSHMSWNLLFSKDAKENLPLPLRLFWNFMIWAVIIGSYSWIVYTYELLQIHLGGKSQEQEL